MKYTIFKKLYPIGCNNERKYYKLDFKILNDTKDLLLFTFSSDFCPLKKHCKPKPTICLK